MKMYLKILTLVMISTSALATDCYNFVTGQGPTQVVNDILDKPAKQVCFTRVSGFGGNYVQITLSDELGSLAELVADDAGSSRCGEVCRNYVVTSGSIADKSYPNGYKSVNYSSAGLTVKLQASTNGRLGVQQGTLEIQTSRSLPKSYNVIRPLR